MRESGFQRRLIKKIRKRFPGCYVLKNDSAYCQGIPDLLILYGKHWATLEVKRSYAESLDPRPNQEYYVKDMNRQSFSSFIFPENCEEVLDAMERSFADS